MVSCSASTPFGFSPSPAPLVALLAGIRRRVTALRSAGSFPAWAVDMLGNRLRRGGGSGGLGNRSARSGAAGLSSHSACGGRPRTGRKPAPPVNLRCDGCPCCWPRPQTCFRHPMRALTPHPGRSGSACRSSCACDRQRDWIVAMLRAGADTCCSATRGSVRSASDLLRLRRPMSAVTLLKALRPSAAARDGRRLGTVAHLGAARGLYLCVQKALGPVLHHADLPLNQLFTFTSAYQLPRHHGGRGRQCPHSRPSVLGAADLRDPLH